MNTKDNSGPAFPEHHYFDPSIAMHVTASNIGCGGMSLRDWFAGMALQTESCTGWHSPRLTAEAAYAIADAMLAARKGEADE